MASPINSINISISKKDNNSKNKINKNNNDKVALL